MNTYLRRCESVRSGGVNVASAGEAGLGLFVTRDTPAGTILLSVPSDAWKRYSLSAGEARIASSGIGERLRSVFSEGVVPPVTMALQLLSQVADDDDGGYARGLFDRDDCRQHPLLWSESQLKELEGSGTLDELASRQQFWTAVHGAVFDSAQLPIRQFLWSVSQVLSRAISGEGKPFTLVPGVCLANHSREATAVVDFDSDREVFQVTATADHVAGDEVSICYGLNRCNGNLLRTYGFVDREPTPHETVSLQVDGRQYRLPRLFADDNGGSAGGSDGLRGAPMLKEHVESALSLFPTSLADDERIIERGHALEPWRRFAVLKRAQEKRILHDYARVLG